METAEKDKLVPPKKVDSTGRIVLGIVFLLPSLFCCIFQLLLPTISTFLLSFQKVNLVGGENVYIGLANYTHLFGNKNFGSVVGFNLMTALVRLLVVALVPLLLAWAVGHFGRPLRLVLRTLLTPPIILFVPIAIAIAWLMFLNPTNGLLHPEKPWTATPEGARFTFLLVDALYFLGLMSGLGLIVYLPLWRRSACAPRPTSPEIIKPMLVTWAVGSLGIIAITLSTFTLNFAMTNGGPMGSTTSLGLLLYQFAFRNFNAGPAASISSLILLVTMLLGIISTLLIVSNRLRLDIVDEKPSAVKASQPILLERSRFLPGIVLTLLVLFFIGICLFSVLPFGWLIPQAFDGDALGRLFERIPLGMVFLNTAMPPLIGATFQVLIPYLAALGIGALRPLGKRSEWLLLPFSPWLFISVLPLSLVHFMAIQKAHMLDTFWGSFSPIWFSVPTLFILTIFFAGRASKLQGEMAENQSQKEPDFFKHFVLPSLPLTAILWLVIVFFSGQDVIWPLLVSVSPERYTVSLTLLRLMGMFSGGNARLAILITFLILPVCIFFLICLVPFQIFYLDRLRLYAENSPSEKTDRELELPTLSS